MRIWSLHPGYLDAKGLVALWRETLLAQAVLRGRTRGYRHHPQLERFRAAPRPVAAVATYLRHAHDESVRRGYHFDRSRISRAGWTGALPVTEGQLAYEWRHLMDKLAVRDPERRAALMKEPTIRPHPIFTVVKGPIESWEKP